MWYNCYIVYIFMYRKGDFKLKKYIKFFSLLLVFTVVFSNFAFASSFSEFETNTETAIQTDEGVIKTDEIVSKVEDGVGEVANTVNGLAYTVIQQISDKSLPVCGLLILWGAIMYFILGIRNLYKKRQGMLLMWGAFTFLVIAKIVNFVFWFFTKVA